MIRHLLFTTTLLVKQDDKPTGLKKVKKSHVTCRGPHRLGEKRAYWGYLCKVGEPSEFSSCAQQAHNRQFVGQPKSVERQQSAVFSFEGKQKHTERLPARSTITTSKRWSVAIVDSTGNILGECKVGQEEIHTEWGGIVPALAREAHERVIGASIERCLYQANLPTSCIDAVAVTMGPGLELCLRVGFEKGREFCLSNGIPFVSVHHLEAHCLTARLFSHDIKFPFLTLLVSGGHCQLILCKNIDKFIVLGGTVDDALGEAFDKIARLLGLSVGGGGGSLVEALANRGNPLAYDLPVPMSKKRDMNFSFAGLKTAVKQLVEQLGGTEAITRQPECVCNIASSFQRVCVQHLHERTYRSLEWCAQNEAEVQHMVVAGGVAANDGTHRWCTDNGVMTAWAGIERLRSGIEDDVKTIDVRARWPIGKLHEEGQNRQV
eukprot:jgi/Galph1/1127/GphlegSOOS_G5790.1